MPDDQAAAALAEIRERNEERIRVMRYTEYTVEHHVAEGDVRRLLAALDAVLRLHRSGRQVIYASPCRAHMIAGNGAQRDCPDCPAEVRTEVCVECRDGLGDPVPSGECRARKAILGALAAAPDTGAEAGRG